MKLPTFFSKKDRSQKKLYFGLLLKEEEGALLLLETTHNGLKIVDKEKFKYTDGWENLSEDVDQALSQIESKIKKTTNKLMIFVYSHFIDEKNHQIREPYLQKIKILVKELELKALGFIDALEAATNYLEVKEGSPLTAIIIEFDKTALTMAVIKGGQRILTNIISKTDNFIDDVSAIFNSQKGKVIMPARIIIYDSGTVDDVSSKILTHSWPEDLFIQLPKVEVIQEDNLIHGLVSVFSEQMIEMDKEESAPKEVMGFVVGRDVIEKNQEYEERNINVKEEAVVNKNKFNFKFPKISFNFLGNLFNKMKIIKFPLIIPLVSIVACFLIALFSIEFFFHKANLKVYFPSQIIKKDFNLAEIINSSLIKSSTVAYDVSDTLQTTGSQTVGEKAKGEVTIFNFDDSEKSFSKGTIVTTDDLKFTLDSDIKVASSSVSGPVKTAGQAKIKVTAQEIGADSNAAKGKKFQIADFPQTNYYGMNDGGAFTGGSKKNIQTVAKKDLETLRDKIINKAKTMDDESIKKSLKSNEKVISELTEVALANEEYTKELGEEANSLDVKAKVQIEYYTYDGDRMNEKILELLRGDLQIGYQITKENIKYQVIKPEKKENNIKMQINAEGRAIKTIAKTDLLKKLILKDKKTLEKILKEQYNAQGYDLNIKNPIPFLKSIMPISQKNINIEISSL